MHLKDLAVAGVLATLCSTTALAETFLPSIFADHMVVQQKKPLRVFGKDNPGQRVEVSFGGQQVQATAEPDGKWQVQIQPPKAGGPYELTVKGSSSKTISDVLVGEVWLCSGQSNMQWSVSSSNNAAAEMAEAAQYPQIRLFNVPNVRNLKPQEDVAAAWQVCDSKSVGPFSAVGYFFGRHLHKEMNVPVGLVNASWGGTRAEAWTAKEELITVPGMKQMLESAGVDQAEAWKKHGAEFEKWIASMGGGERRRREGDGRLGKG